jgi:hypothetical protein
MTLADINREQKIFSPIMINAPVVMSTTWKCSGMPETLDINCRIMADFGRE